MDHMGWFLWVVRAIIIAVGIILIIMIRRGEKGYAFRFHTIGITTLILGGILLIVAFTTDLLLFYALYLIGVGVICVLIGLVIRNIWEKNRMHL